jgi:hypothetical protein
MVLDVVCKMEIDEKTSKQKFEYKGKNIPFLPTCASRSSIKIWRSNVKTLKVLRNAFFHEEELKD